MLVSISFAESLKNYTNTTATEFEPAIMDMPLMTPNEDYGIAAYSGEDGSWQQHAGYVRYSAFSDDNISTINNEKDISLNSKQINITQEENSQYIPFEMPRYYDGFDLVNTVISIHYSTKSGRHGASKPINVTFNNEKIRFGWLVDAGATLDVGTLEFEIHAYGTVTGTDGVTKGYTWKTKSNKTLNVIQSICNCEDVINNIDDTWLQELITDVAQKVANEIKDVAVGEHVEAAEKAAENAEEYSNIAKQHADDAASAATDAVNKVLSNYATTDYVDTAVSGVDVTEQLAGYVKTSDLSSKLGTLINEEGAELTVEAYVKQEVEAIDVSEQIGELGTYDDGTPITTVVDYVDKKVGDVDVSEQLNDYYKKSETYNKTEIDGMFGNVTVDLTGYATESYVNNIAGALDSNINTNTAGISSLGDAIRELQETINSVDTSTRYTYDVVYNDVEDPEIGENMFGLYEIQNEGQENEFRRLKTKFPITGGGSDTGSILKIAFVTTSPVIATMDEKVLITYNFSGTDSSGDIISEGDYTWRIGSKIIASGVATYGENTFDATDFVTNTEQTFSLSITTDEGRGFASKHWKVKRTDVRLDSSFSDADPFDDDISFNYIPYGSSIEKEIHFVLDGNELGTVTTLTSGVPAYYPIPSQTHGSHLLEVYMTAKVNGKTIGLEEITDEDGEVIGYNHTIKVVRDIMWRDKESDVPIIGCATQVIDVVQYNQVGIKYAVFDPNTETPKVVWSVDDRVIKEETLTEKDEHGYYTFPYKASEAGTFVLTVSCGDAEPKKITINVKELNLGIEPVISGLEFDFNPVGYSNSSTNRLWTNGVVYMDVTPNFDWVNGGYQYDENGDQYFCIKAGTRATINYNLFADDPKKTGKEFKVVFRTKNIRKRDTSFLTCIDNNIGLDMKIEHASIYSSGGVLKSDYCENAIIEYEFNINRDTDMPIVMSYEDGAPYKPYEYTKTTSFKQPISKPITIGSDDCDVFIYRMKAYSNSLTDTDIKNNFILDARNSDEMIARYNRNQIYTDGRLISTSASGGFSVDALMKAAPDLRYIFLEAPQFTNDKDNSIDGCTVYFRYPAGTRPQDNWDCTGVRHKGQGTSSNSYGYAGRNIDLCMDRDESLFTWTDTDEDGKPIKVESSTITLTDTSVPTDYLNIKVNIASSENANNAQLVRRFNEYQPFLRYARKKDSRVKDTMEFYNCVVFIRETSTDLSNTPHREFNDNDWHFYAIGNVGDSKKTDDTRVNNKRDPKEHVIEITDADKPLCAFPTGKDNHAICPVTEWKPGNTAYDILYSNEYVYDDEGKFESFGGGTYEFRYEMKNITDEQRQSNIDTWRDLYKFIVTSNDKDFHAHLKDYFVVDSALYFYLFTERYTMVDNRAKNTFWHYGKVYISNEEAAELGETEASYYIIDDASAAINDGYRYDLTFAYDMDTALGIDNTGDYVFSYGKEDTDYYVDGDPTSDYVFRVADSVFFCRLRDLFPTELQVMFKDREEKNAWSSDSLINQWDESQAQFPEELWRLDYERKYYRTYLGLSIDNSIVPVQNDEDKKSSKTFLIGKFFGRKKYARRSFEINQEIYFATKYFGSKALLDVFWFRGNAPIGSNIKPNYSITLVPYSDMYLCMQYSSTGKPIHSMDENKNPKRIRAGESYTFENNSESMDFIYIFAAGYIQEVGDLSRCYPGDNEFSSAVRLQKLVIGSADDGYNNTFMNEVLVGNNPLLEHLDIRNVYGINEEIDLSGCSNLKELYAEGTNATEVDFANGGLLHTAHLPNTLVSMTMKNLNYVNDFVVDGYDKLQTLVVENVPGINTYDIVANSPSLRIIRLINLNWSVENSSILEKLFGINGIDSSGYETDQSVLTGNVYIRMIKESEYNRYKDAWPDLKFDWPENGFTKQHLVEFVNDNDELLYTQYVDDGGYVVDPLENGDMTDVPIKESSVSTDYNFIGWYNTDRNEMWEKPKKYQIFKPITMKAVYGESVRKYGIRYVLKDPGNDNEIVLQESIGEYGTNVPFDRKICTNCKHSNPADAIKCENCDHDKFCDVPIYDALESNRGYYLFSGWDKSGFLLEGKDGTDLDSGVKTVTAVFDTFKYVDDAFDGRSLSDLSPVEIYALIKLTEPGDKELADYDMEIETGDDYSFTMGYDVDYDDIDSVEVISEKRVFSGSTNDCYDTGITLFDEDKDFVLALDYKMSQPLSGVTNATLMQCYQTSGTNGFKLSYASHPVFAWGGITVATDGTTVSPSATDSREMLVIRHKKGDKNLYIYTSDINSDDIKTCTIERDIATQSDTATLVFGAAKADSGRFGNYAVGEVNWCKIWYKDLGDFTCRKLVSWIHEKINLEVSGFHRYQLYDDTSKESMVSLLATHLLGVRSQYNVNSNENTDGWKGCKLNKFLNSRFYNAIPYQIQVLIKKVSVGSTVGNNSTATNECGCYISVPALYDVDDSASSQYRGELYEFANTIDFFTGLTDQDEQTNRKRYFDDYRLHSNSDEGVQYWLRSPSINTAWTTQRYCHSVLKNGSIQSVTGTNSNLGILIEISF